jgi:ABC-type transporter Mla subunit MlaD
VRRLISIGIVIGALAAALALAGASNPAKSKRTYKITFDTAFGLAEGGDFRVGGVKAGKTTKFDVVKKKGHSPKAVVTAQINQPGFDDFRSDASCEIKPQSLIGEYYVDCQPGNAPKKLPTDGSGVVPVDHTSSTVPIDLVNNVLRKPYRERFRLIVSELGTGLAGRPADLNEVVRRAHPGLRETTKVLRILGNQNSIIEHFIGDSDRVVGELENNKRDVVRWVKTAGRTAEISATRKEEIRQGFHKLPTFLGELKPTMARLGELTDQQRPMLAELQRAAPDLNTFLTRLGPFAEAGRPALRSLGKAGVKGSAAIRESDPEINVLRQLSTNARPTFKPLRQFLQTLDDRKRAIENDSRAVKGSPPAPDPTHISGKGGFTGMELLWNYFFWQSLDLNGYDQTGHVLRTSVTATDCSPLTNKEDPNSAHFKKCSQWLGPNLPGITTPDFTDNGSMAKLRAEASTPAKKVGERRDAGQPDAAPLPGQRDISKPQVTVPPAVKQLLDNLPRAQREEAQKKLNAPGPVPAPPSSGANDTQLLDFLLGP